MYLTKNIYTTNPILSVKWFLNNLRSKIVAYQAHLIIKYGPPDLRQSDVVKFLTFLCLIWSVLPLLWTEGLFLSFSFMLLLGTHTLHVLA